ncbi:uncharacterized protein LOC127282146 [Leptopilina boulardi]|uniref:uncharacterized protein LOC127282146 n=1 Tax=Leptopilina boulardi TaxID=63433 RepID=UPI0021F63F8B|nr:uncharacterized protein LOC127282146 [Leptopilina boulardi]
MLKQLGGWNSSSIAEGYVENSLKNRELIIQGITNAARSNNDSTNNPSTSKQCVEPTPEVANVNHLFDDFDVTEEELCEIDELNLLKETAKASRSEFKTAKNEKLNVPCIQSKVPTHFMSKSPIKVPFTENQKEPPLKKRKIREEGINTNEQTSGSLNSVENVHDFYRITEYRREYST